MVDIYVYHYCATSSTFQYKTTHDGIARLGFRITCMDDYLELKNEIDPVHHKKLTITSLTYLGVEEDNEI